ncbi:MAG: peptidoglycan recognition protein family protein [Planctomycetes bacterium]|nr:peptidoglycan recognition protein family protein [Planctomycetota bacterium]
MFVPDKRTLIVLTSLVAAMTVASAVLLILEPRPVIPAEQIMLSSLERDSDSDRQLFETTPPPTAGRWTAIVIHNSGAVQGSSATINRLHEQLGRGGNGYHFVIGNGSGMPDGQVEAGFRWSRQLVGAYAAGPGSDFLNRRAIGICLVGDFSRQPPTQAQLRELIWVVRHLQTQFGIPPEHVVVQMLPEGQGAGRYFPTLAFRQQIVQQLPASR